MHVCVCILELTFQFYFIYKFEESLSTMLWTRSIVYFRVLQTVEYFHIYKEIDALVTGLKSKHEISYVTYVPQTQPGGDSIQYI